MSTRLPLINILSILGELKKSTWAENVTYKGRILWKSISIQKDIGDLIIQAVYYGKRTKFCELDYKDLTKMQNLEHVGGLPLEYCGFSRDGQYQTQVISHELKLVLGSKLIQSDSFVNFTSMLITNKLTRDKVRLVNDMEGVWSFIQYPQR